jgi:hypothetical protein
MRPGQSKLELQLKAGFWVAQVRDSAKFMPSAMALDIMLASIGNVDTDVMVLVAGLNTASV